MITTSLTTNGLLSQLAEEVIEEYDTGESGAEVADIVADLLAFQRKATPITVGTIGVTGTRAIQVTTARTILSVLLELQESVGGYINVDNDRVLDWPTDTGEDKGQQIRYRKNLVGIERTRNWEDFCTKLHLTGGEGKLSDISVGPVAVDTDTDATYGYITLKERYAAYKDWIAEGADLPPNISVWKQNAGPVWKVSTGVDSSPGWTNPGNAIDDDWDTYGKSDCVLHDTWTNYITCSIESGYYGTVKFKWEKDVCYGTATFRMRKFEISVYDGADWTIIYSGMPSQGSQVTQTFAGQTVEKFRVRALSTYEPAVASSTIAFELYECQFYQSDVTDDSDKWEQGEFENVIRCAIGDWDAGATYQISYTYANYLMAWDKITTADDIVARIVPVPSTSYGISLLQLGILLVDETKEESYAYAIDAVNLAEVDKKFSFDELQLGSIITVIDEDLGIDISARVVRISFDALQPERMQIEISSRIRDIADIIAGMNKLIREV